MNIFCLLCCFLLFVFFARRPLAVMEKDEMFDIVKVTEEVETYTQIDGTPPKKRKNKGQEVCMEKPKKPR